MFCIIKGCTDSFTFYTDVELEIDLIEGLTVESVVSLPLCRSHRQIVMDAFDANRPPPDLDVVIRHPPDRTKPHIMLWGRKKKKDGAT